MINYEELKEYTEYMPWWPVLTIFGLLAVMIVLFCGCAQAMDSPWHASMANKMSGKIFNNINAGIGEYKMNMIAFDDHDSALFGRDCRNKDMVRKEVVFNEYAYQVKYIIYKHKRYEMKEVYTWK